MVSKNYWKMEHKTKWVPNHNMSYLQKFFNKMSRFLIIMHVLKLKKTQNIQIRWSKKMKREYFIILSHKKPFQNIFNCVSFLLQRQHQRIFGTGCPRKKSPLKFIYDFLWNFLDSWIYSCLLNCLLQMRERCHVLFKFFSKPF